MLPVEKKGKTNLQSKRAFSFLFVFLCARDGRRAMLERSGLVLWKTDFFFKLYVRTYVFGGCVFEFEFVFPTFLGAVLVVMRGCECG